MSAKKSAIGANWSVYHQTKDSFFMAVKKGVIKGNNAREQVGLRKDVPDAKKNICLIRSNNGRPPSHKWVGHLPNRMEEKYHKIEESGKIFLIGRDLWNKAGGKLLVSNLIDEIISELEEKTTRQNCKGGIDEL